MPRIPDEISFNSNYTAIPKDITYADDPHVDADLVVTPFDYGEMNEEDARESGYISEPPIPDVRVDATETVNYRIAAFGIAVAAIGAVAWFAYQNWKYAPRFSEAR